VGATLTAMQVPRLVLIGAVVVVTALLSAVMSNTAAATVLIPMGIALVPDSTALPVLIAMGASFGMPFVISTPPQRHGRRCRCPPPRSPLARADPDDRRLRRHRDHGTVRAGVDGVLMGWVGTLLPKFSEPAAEGIDHR